MTMETIEFEHQPFAALTEPVVQKSNWGWYLLAAGIIVLGVIYAFQKNNDAPDEWNAAENDGG
ncbi:MAG: hypothetical protein JKX84_09020 [Flavobacteriales bacterium]|nr:hypothetical protein [Flavobacteriales bacterium]